MDLKRLKELESSKLKSSSSTETDSSSGSSDSDSSMSKPSDSESSDEEKLVPSRPSLPTTAPKKTPICKNLPNQIQSTSLYKDCYEHEYEIKDFVATLQTKNQFCSTFKEAKSSVVFRSMTVFQTIYDKSTKWVWLKVSWNPFPAGTSSPKVFTRFQVSLRNKDNQLLKQRGSLKGGCFPHSGNNSRLFKKFIKVEELTELDSKNALILKVACRMWHLPKEKSRSTSEATSSLIRSLTNEGACSTNGSFHARKKICSDFKILLQNSSFHDVEIVTSSKKFKAHRSVLSARSSVFCAMLSANMSEANSGIIKIDDFGDDVIEKMLKYIYCGEVKDFEKNILELLKIADKYNIEDMKKKCVQIVPSLVNVKDATNMLIVADQLNLHKLKSGIIKFINLNKTAVLKTVSFKKLEKVYPSLLGELYAAL